MSFGGRCSCVVIWRRFVQHRPRNSFFWVPMVAHQMGSRSMTFQRLNEACRPHQQLVHQASRYHDLESWFQDLAGVTLSIGLHILDRQARVLLTLLLSYLLCFDSCHIGVNALFSMRVLALAARVFRENITGIGHIPRHGSKKICEYLDWFTRSPAIYPATFYCKLYSILQIQWYPKSLRLAQVGYTKDLMAGSI